MSDIYQKYIPDGDIVTSFVTEKHSRYHTLERMSETTPHLKLISEAILSKIVEIFPQTRRSAVVLQQSPRCRETSLEIRPKEVYRLARYEVTPVFTWTKSTNLPTRLLLIHILWCSRKYIVQLKKPMGTSSRHDQNLTNQRKHRSQVGQKGGRDTITNAKNASKPLMTGGGAYHSNQKPRWTPSPCVPP